MKRITYEILGSFGKKKNRIEISLSKHSSRLIILLHGAFGYPYHIAPTKYHFFIESLSSEYHICLYQTSRYFEWRERPQLTFESYRDASFDGKTFAMELNDVLSSCREIVARTKKETQKKVLDITLVGFSLGGIMSIYVSAALQNVDSIFMIGTGVRFLNDFSVPVLGSLPSEKGILRKLGAFGGAAHFLRGSLDDMATSEATRLLFESATHAEERSLVEYKGVDHRFISKNGRLIERELNSVLLTYIRNNIPE
ncbi:MAG: hypothetical protein Q7S76_00785 [bacterium]|nr:hypothetical protein [bacterium]